MKREKLSTRSAPARLRPLVFTFAMVAVPVIFFVGLEVLLRVFGYGHDLSPLVAQELRHQTWYRLNPDVKYRYFGSSHFAPATAADYFQLPKPPGTFRVFCLGGSTTAGFPYMFNGAFPAFLRERLRKVFPDRNIEVLNCGMTATNSFTVLDLARDLAGCQPDCFVVYDGHNEFYGALGAASRQSLGPSRWLAQVYLRLIRFRSVQLLADGYRALMAWVSSKGASTPRGTMMEVLARDRIVPSGSAVYDNAYTTFSSNMLDLRDLCEREHIPLLLGTQVSNLHDQAPFVSVHGENTTPARKLASDEGLRQGKECLARDALDSAERAFRTAIEADSRYAEPHYRLAQCLDLKKDSSAARTEYVAARDEDALRFRTDSKFNALIRSIQRDGSCIVVDVDSLFAAHSPGGVPGRSLIWEHLHPNATGNFLIAAAYARAMHQQAILFGHDVWDRCDTVSEEELWDAAPITKLDERIAERNTEVLTSSWPFVDRAHEPMPIAANDTIGEIADQLVHLSLDWKRAHELAIAEYQRRGAWAEVVNEYRALVSEIPLDLELQMNLVKAQYRIHDLPGMEATLLRSLAIYPTLQAYRTLGDVKMQQGDPAGALPYYEKMGAFPQSAEEQLQNGGVLALALMQSGKLQQAKGLLENLVRSYPRVPQLQSMLADVNNALQAEGTPR